MFQYSTKLFYSNKKILSWISSNSEK